MNIGEKKLAAMDDVVYGERWKPRSGWHDDHVQRDGTPEYLPAIMQSSVEFAMLTGVLADRDLLSGRFLQLGVGECAASHHLWLALFDDGGVTLDRNGFYSNDEVFPGGDTHDPAMLAEVARLGPYEFLFVDAGHDFEDARRDHLDCGPMVVPGGVIAFHDALFRKTYPEVEVWRYLQTLDGVVHLCASDVGVAFLVKK